ncbi:MAG: DedA family protein [Candidatus Woesebacteria bacterium]|nr:MAG: DedA family protein [Candidatus Woesebacteria bacterium]
MQYLTEILTSFISSYGYLAVFILMTAESALIPIPSEITMAFAGFLVGINVINFWMAVFLGALGNLVGSLLAFYLGRAMGEQWIRDAIRKWGKWILVHEKDFDTALAWFKKYGQGIAFGSRLLPIIRTFISLPAGIAEMNVVKFSIFTFIGSFIWSAFLAYLGLKLGQNWEVIDPYFRKFQFLIVGLGVAAVGFYIYSHLKRKKE